MPANPDLLTCRICKHAFEHFAVDETGRCNGCRLDTQRRWSHRSESKGRTWDDIRGIRAVELQRSDWSQLPDVPETLRTKWAAYRQAWRDITEQGDDPNQIVFPEAPDLISGQ